MITKINIPCVWGGHLAGILMKNQAVKVTKKIIGVHGWLDNLNSMLPIAEKLIDRHPDYEIYLYDRAGHGFSSHFPRGSDNSHGCNLRDLRTVVRGLGWDKDKFSFFAHSYGGHLSMAYAAAYPEEVSCLVALDSIIGAPDAAKSYWKNVGQRIDSDLKYYGQPIKEHKSELTYEKAIDLVRNTRTGISDEAAKLLLERSTRRDKYNKLHFTRDESLKRFPIMPLSQDVVDDAIRNIKASVLFIRTTKPQWPIQSRSIQLLKETNPNFQMELIEGSHHFHMTHVDRVLELIEQYFAKHLK